MSSYAGPPLETSSTEVLICLSTVCNRPLVVFHLHHRLFVAVRAVSGLNYPCLMHHHWLRHQWLLVVTRVDGLLICFMGIVHVVEQLRVHVLRHVMWHVLGAEVLYEVFILVRLTSCWSSRSS